MPKRVRIEQARLFEAVEELADALSLMHDQLSPAGLVSPASRARICAHANIYCTFTTLPDGSVTVTNCNLTG